MPTARILVVDDHPLFRAGVSQMIEEEDDLTVCGEAESLRAARDAVDELDPDLVLLDVALDGASGLDLIKQLRGADRQTPVLVLSMHDEMLFAERALRAGALGYMMKHEPADEVLLAIRRALAGDVAVSKRMSAMMLQRLRGGGATPASPVSGLSDRELEVYELLGRGFAPREIASSLHISVKTVASHQSNIRAKLGLRTQHALIRAATNWVLHLEPRKTT